jgi:MFS family permease
MLLPFYFLVITIPFYWLVLLSDNTPLILIAFQVPIFFAISYMGPSFTVVQNLSTSSNRAFNASVLIFAINVIGLGFGPLLSGILSDYLHRQNDISSLRHALTVVTSLNLPAAYFYWLAAKHMATSEVIPNFTGETTRYQQN